MKKLSVFLGLVLFSATTWAYEIESYKYDSYAKILYVDLVFEGGEKEHHFTPDFDDCRTDTYPRQLAVRLVDSGWDDTGSHTLRETAVIELARTNCLPAEVTVFVSKKRLTLYLE